MSHQSKTSSNESDGVHDRQSAPGWISSGRIPGLDALRAISIVLVLIAHVLFAKTKSFNVLVIGVTGVDTFFVISGFLITLLLLRERSRNGKISLRGFYTRRAFRILPAYCAYLITIFIATRVGLATASPADWIAALTYTMNWRTAPTWVLGHIWSLSVEEQFYLLWPPLFIMLSSRSAKRMLVCCIVVAPLYRIAMRALFPDLVALGRVAFPAQLEPIAAGCLFAMLASDPKGLDLIQHWFGERRHALFATLMLSICTILASRSKIFALFGHATCNALLLPVVIWGCANAGNSLLGKLLSLRPVVTVGVLSYSIYLWQQPLLDGSNPSPACKFPTNVGLALAAAICSYVLIERPMLMIKDRATTASSPPSPQGMARSIS